jgi:poly(A) polymerase
VTTLRRDVATDGRRATVAFTDRIEEDAERRDFTVNALYATRRGEVLDPVEQGLDDLRARRIRFIGDPHDRIREDYLRILRFFRFHAWYADPGQGMDADGLAASAELARGSTGSRRNGSGWRCASFWPRPTPPLPSRRWRRPGPATGPAGGGRSAAAGAGGRSKAVRRPTRCAGSPRSAGRGRTTRCACRGPRHSRWSGCATAWRTGAGPVRAGLSGTGRGWRATSCCCAARCRTGPVDATAEAELEAGARAVFPVKAADLMPEFSGPALGAELERLERLWIESGFRLSADELLNGPRPA